MALVTCPKCNTQNSGDALYCVTCGTGLSGVPRMEARPVAPMAPGSSHIPPPAFSTYSPAPPPATSYAALRGIASLCKVLGWIVIGLAGLNALGGLITLNDSFLLGIGIIMLSVVSGGVFFIILRVIGEGISVFLDIEANTRRMAVILEERLK